MYRASIIGLGNIGFKLDLDPSRPIIWTHAKAYDIHHKTELVSVSDVNKKNLIDFSKIYSGMKFYENHSEMLLNEKIDILSICVPTGLHLSIIKDAVKNKFLKAIFIEKPMGDNLEEAKIISSLCEKNNIVLAVNYMRRWECKYQKIFDMIKSRELGNLRSINAFGSTAFKTSACHLLDLILFYGGDPNWVIGSHQSDFVRIVDGKEDPGGFCIITFSNDLNIGLSKYLKFNIILFLK